MTKFQALCAAAAALMLLSSFGAGAAETLGADRHAAAGVKCEACHGADRQNPKTPDISVCAGCHNIDGLVEKTSKAKPANPHVSPHYNKELECTNCHHMHSQSEDFCAQCHNFKYQVP